MKMWKRLAALGAAALLTLSMLAGCGSEESNEKNEDKKPRRDPKRVYLEDYLVFEEQGYDGKGRVAVSLDWDAILEDNSQWLELVRYDEGEGRYYFSYEDKDGKIYRYTPAASNPEEAVMSLVTGYFPRPQLTQEEATDLSNGDKVDVVWEADEGNVDYVQNMLGKKLVFEDLKHTMSGLTVIEKIDPFVFLSITYRDMVAQDGKNGYHIGTAASTTVILPGEKEVKIPVDVHVTGDEFLTRQDSVHVSIDESDIQQYVEFYGTDLFTRLEADISLEDMSYLPVGKEAREIFDYVDDSCLENVAFAMKDMADGMTGTETEVELLGMLYYYDDEGVLKSDDDSRRYYNQLVMVYKITNDRCPQGWYTFMAYNGYVAVGTHFSVETGEFFRVTGNIYGQHLHDDFRYYKNEHPRIWKNQPMEQTFECDGTQYPGHLTLEEMFQALNTNFMDGMDFAHVVVTPELAQYVKEY